MVFVQLLFSALAAYAFSRFRFNGRRGGLLALLLIQMFPQFLAAVALFTMFTEHRRGRPAIGLNTLARLHPGLCGGALGQVWLIKGFFDSIPLSLDEAAMIDGASHVQVFFRIILPLVTPILAVCGLLVFVGTIAEFLLASHLPDRQQQEDPGDRALRPARRRPLQQPRRLRGRRRDDRDPRGAAVPLPAAVHRRRHHRRWRQGVTRPA